MWCTEEWVGRVCARLRSHRGGAPTKKPIPPPTRRSTRPGCESGPAGDVVCAGLVHTGAVLLQQKPIPPPTRRSTRPGCEWGAARGEDLCLPGSHRGRCSYNRTTTQPRPVGAPAPGAKGGLHGAKTCVCPVRTEAVLLQHNQSHLLQQNLTRPRTVGAPAPGAKGVRPAQRRLSGSLWGCWTASARRRRTWLRG